MLNQLYLPSKLNVILFITRNTALLAYLDNLHVLHYVFTLCGIIINYPICDSISYCLVTLLSSLLVSLSRAALLFIPKSQVFLSK